MRRLLLLLTIAVLIATSASPAAQAVTQPALRAAFLYNFAKFTEWPPESTPLTPLNLCVVDDTAVEDSLRDLVGNSTINGRTVAIAKGAGAGPDRLRNCHLLYVGDGSAARANVLLDELDGAPVLTVSNGVDFVRDGGMVGLFVEDGRMRFIINPDAAHRAGVRLSSRLLQLAKIFKAS